MSRLRVLLLPDPRFPDALAPVRAALEARGLTVVSWLPQDVPTDAALEAFVDGALAAAGDAPAGVVGVGLGGVVAQRLAVEAAERVRKLVLVATWPAPSEAQRGRAQRSDDAWTRFLAALPEWEWPGPGLRTYAGSALVVEAGADPDYSPVATMLWRPNLPDAEVVRTEQTLENIPQDSDVQARLAQFLTE